MSEKSTVGFFVVESPVHCGTGQEVGIVDLPIQRERYTGYPRIQGSEVKGIFRQDYKGDNKDEIFGPETTSDTEAFASAVSFGDAKILFFPVKSLKGTYVWITSKDALDKFQRILKIAEITDVSIPEDIPSPKDDEIIVYDESLKVNDKVILEEYCFTPKVQQNLFEPIINRIILDPPPQYAYLKDMLKKKICILSNDNFREFTAMSTEVITRIRINRVTGVVEPGHLWTEEYLPTDTILYFSLFVADSKNKNAKLEAEKVSKAVKGVGPYLQIGGNETIGKGFVRLFWLDINER